MSDEQHTILIVDDEPDLTDIVEYRFSAAGFNTFTAASGREALACLQQNQVDVILSDVRMPDITGVELLKQVRNDGGLRVAFHIMQNICLSDIRTELIDVKRIPEL